MDFKKVKEDLYLLLEKGTKTQVFDFLDKMSENTNITNAEYTNLLILTKNYYMEQNYITKILNY